jgi:protocatechuate 3,4-dioxygenase beta subunit
MSADEPVTAAVATALARSRTTCQLLAEQEEGPYRRGDQPRRRDLTEGRPGSPLRLGLRLRGARDDAIAGADVEIWHCDAEGRYSGYPPSVPGVVVDATPVRPTYLPDETFLRGRQTSDEVGAVEFRTIYPGWYPGRTVHVHLLVHTPARSYVSQLYFPEDVTAEVFSLDPYRARGLPDTTHATDGIFATGGQPAVLEIGAQDGVRLGLLCLVLPE